MFFSVISQKIKSLWRYIKVKLYGRKCDVKSIENVKNIKKELPEITYPVKVSLDCSNFIQTVEFVLNKANTSGYNLGIGIIASDIAILDGLNTVMNYACTRFKYVTVYTNNSIAAESMADLIFSKYGLPIMVLETSEAQKCRYPVIADFDCGKLRYGRDMCVSGIAQDKNGSVVGVYLGERMFSI